MLHLSLETPAESMTGCPIYPVTNPLRILLTATPVALLDGQVSQDQAQGRKNNTHSWDRAEASVNEAFRLGPPCKMAQIYVSTKSN